MSAPVVRCVIGIPPDGKARRHVIAAEYATTAREGDRPALAVPDALWGDADFMAAVWQRLNYSDPGVVIQTIDAIHAELHSRAGGAA